jgi:serine protease Do
MKKILAIALIIALAVGCVALAVTNEEAEQIASSVTQTTTDKALSANAYTETISRVQNSVLGVNNYQEYRYNSYGNGFGYGFGFGYGYGGGNRGRSDEAVEQLAATGSGVVVYKELVLTNYHVVENAKRLSVSAFGDEEELDGTLLAYDEAQDLAVIYVPGLEVEAVPLGDSDQLQVGEWAICIGNPLMDELSSTVTLGIISGLNRAISSTTVTDKYGLKTKITNTMIQTDAAINSGNSGGGLFNVQGQLMGIPSRKYSGATSNNTYIEGIGLAIPINTAKPVISEAIVKLLTGDNSKADDISGSAQTVSGDKPMLGVTGSMVSTGNYYLVYAGLLPGGMLISEVSGGSPAALAGIKPYDVIVEVDGQIATSLSVIRAALDAHAFGDTINVKVYRLEGLENAETTDDLGEGEYLDFEVTLFDFDNET